MSAERDFKDLEDYGIIGNLETCALIGRDGSVDWLCLPELGSPAVFAALLDPDKGGHFFIRPVDKYESVQSYDGRTNVLKTRFKTAFGELVVTDFMPVVLGKQSNPQRAVIRRVCATEDHFRVRAKFAPRFDYARSRPVFETWAHGVSARHRQEKLFLQSPVELDVGQESADAEWELKKGQVRWFVLQYGRERRMRPRDCAALLTQTKRYWEGWERPHHLHKKPFRGPIYDTIVRSGLVLKLLTNPAVGSIAAAATTSLPEEIGGVRNWDYRFAWIRDASFTAQALFHLGHVKEAAQFVSWIESVIGKNKSPADIRIMYGLHGQTRLEERNINVLSGYRNSAPVRVGNAAHDQRQHDIYGELVNAVYETSRYGRKISARTWKDMKAIVNYVCGIWREKDSGIWEVRGKPRDFVYSKLMCWVAVDRGIKIARKKRDRAPLKKWEKTREEIRDAVLQKGFSRRLNSFVQSFGSETLDASCLLIPLVGFLPFDDPRVRGTVDAVERQLTVRRTFVRRYQTEDGLPGREGAFVICTFWLVKALLLSGRVKDGKEYFANILNYVSPLGLLAEEIDPETGKQLGNFPQAFSHIGLINSALYLAVVKGRKHRGPKPMGIVNNQGGNDGSRGTLRSG